MHSFANKLGQSTQGIRDIPRTDATQLIPKSKVPLGYRITYEQIIVYYHQQRAEPCCTCLTIGEYCIDLSLGCQHTQSKPHNSQADFQIKTFYPNNPLIHLE